VAPSLKGALRFVLFGPHTLPGKVARTISARHALLTDNHPSGKLHTAHYRQLKLYSRNLFNITIAVHAVNTAQPLWPGKKYPWNHPSNVKSINQASAHQYYLQVMQAAGVGQIGGPDVEEIPARIYTEVSSILCAFNCFSRRREKGFATALQGLSLLFSFCPL
jgi:hypothetical protein